MRFQRLGVALGWMLSAGATGQTPGPGGGVDDEACGVQPCRQTCAQANEPAPSGDLVEQAGEEEIPLAASLELADVRREDLARMIIHLPSGAGEGTWAVVTVSPAFRLLIEQPDGTFLAADRAAVIEDWAVEQFTVGRSLYVQRIAAGDMDAQIQSNLCPACPQSCDDGAPCTIDYCLDFACHHLLRKCNDASPCTQDFCNAQTGACVNQWLCGEGDACTYIYCGQHGCESVATDCDDGNACTEERCDPQTGVCLYEWLCQDDGDPCTIDSCDPAVGCSHVPRDCDDDNACTDYRCDPDWCFVPPYDCCVHEWLCNDGDPCTIDSCDPAAGCSNVPRDCDDDNACTMDRCDPDWCFVPPYDCCVHEWQCNDDDPCTIDSCDPEEGCSNLPLDCDDDNACTADRCDPNSPVLCVNEWQCDDGDVCTYNICDPDTGCSNPPKDCDDEDLCTDDRCDSETGACINEFRCDDGDCCTYDDCDPQTGACRHTPVAGGAEIWVYEWLGVNDNDDGDPAGEDRGNDVIDGEDDLSADIWALEVSALGWDANCPGHSMTLTVSGPGRVRVFDKRELDAQAILSGAGSVTLPSDGAPSWSLGVEGLEPGEVTLAAVHRCGGVVLGQAEADLTVVQAKLDIARLTGETVPQNVEFSEGSITKITVPELDEYPAQWRLSLPMVDVLPESARDALTMKLWAMDVADNEGRFRVLRDGEVVLSEHDVDLDLAPEDLAGQWSMEAAGAGAIDLCLRLKIGNTLLHDDCVRVFAALDAPGTGQIHVVSPTTVFDAGRYRAHSTIAAGLAASGPFDNVVIGRGTYTEWGLAVPEGAHVLGLGGEIEPGWNHLIEPWNMPVVDGQLRNAIFIMTNYRAFTTHLAGLEMTRGQSLQGGAIRIVNCTSRINVKYNYVRDNRAFPAPGYGAGIYINKSNAAHIEYNMIKRNDAAVGGAVNGGGGGGGGGIFVQDAPSVHIARNLIESNEAYYGGGIGCRGTITGLDANIFKNDIQNNSAFVGGGIGIVGMADYLAALQGLSFGESVRAAFGGMPCSVRDNRILSNQAAGDEVGRGGGVFNSARRSVLELESNKIRNNVSRGSGSGITIHAKASIDAHHNTIEENGPSGTDGGGIDQRHGAQGTWNDNFVHKNRCNNNGGALHASNGGKVMARDNKFINSVANGARGGGVHLRNVSFESEGGNKILYNEAALSDGGGMAIESIFDEAAGPSYTVSLRSGDEVNVNTARSYGGGVYMEERGFAFTTAVDFVSAVFDANHADLSVAGHATAGVHLFKCEDFTINGNTFLDHGGAALTGQGLGRDLLERNRIDWNHWTLNKVAINLVDSKAIVTDNDFNNSMETDIQLLRVENIDIVHNAFNHGLGGKFGIWVDRSDYGWQLGIDYNNFAGYGRTSGAYAIYVSYSVIGSLGGWYFIDATHNWWNHPQGPDDAPFFCLDGECNTNPAGDAVYDAVRYRPWGTARY